MPDASSLPVVRGPARRIASVLGVLTLAVVLGEAARAANDAAEAAAATTAYHGGLWYDGERFVPRPAYVRDGMFVEPPDAPGATVDLEGGFVLPAFAEGHHHTVLCEPGRIKSFIDAGVLYAAIMNARVSSRACQAKMHGADGIEVVSALAGLTATDAHPAQIGRYFLDADEIDGEWVHYVDAAGDLDRVWPRIAAQPPDLVKIYLSYSEDHARLRDDESIAAWYRGLDPALVPAIVRRARTMDLRVAAHVMSAQDFEVAVDGGVDIVAHLPGFAPGAAFTDEPDHPYLAALSDDPARYRITPAAARRAAARGVVVVTTVSGAPPAPAIAANLRALREAHVTLLIGSDRGEFHSVDEAVFLVEQGLMPAAEVVRALSVTTPRFLFPDRAVGRLDAGAEATFVVLRGDPLVAIANLRDPRRVVKRGVTLAGDIR